MGTEGPKFDPSVPFFSTSLCDRFVQDVLNYSPQLIIRTGKTHAFGWHDVIKTVDRVLNQHIHAFFQTGGPVCRIAHTWRSGGAAVVTSATALSVGAGRIKSF